MAASMLTTFRAYPATIRLCSNAKQLCLCYYQHRSINVTTTANEEHNNKSDTLTDQIKVTYDESLPVPVKSYQPPKNVDTRVLSIAAELMQEQPTPTIPLTDNTLKFEVLTRCMNEFNFHIPSSRLAEMNQLSDVINYFNTSWQKESNVEQDLQADLPDNVHVLFEPVRFTDDTKHYFKGKTAFPKRDTIVTSLKYKNKYQGYKNPLTYTKKKGFQYY